MFVGLDVDPLLALLVDGGVLVQQVGVLGPAPLAEVLHLQHLGQLLLVDPVLQSGLGSIVLGADIVRILHAGGIHVEHALVVILLQKLPLRLLFAHTVLCKKIEHRSTHTQSSGETIVDGVVGMIQNMNMLKTVKRHTRRYIQIVTQVDNVSSTGCGETPPFIN